ncbi:MAG: hypothetical protein WDO71_08505 [Bacteroidota bacterium]
MKLSYLWIAVIVLSFTACKKDKQVISTPDTIKEDDYTICADDN